MKVSRQFSDRPFYMYLLVLLLPAVLHAETTSQPDTIEEKELQTIRDREHNIAEDPLMQRQAERIDQPRRWLLKPDDFNLYGSVRIRHRDTGPDSFWGDGGSRAGLSGQWKYNKDSWVFGRVETGINLLDELDLLINRGDRASGNKFGETVFLRLLYAGVETPNMMLSAGKSWSTYYQVSSFTDRFQGTGASASGTFNAGTDGGYTGTGRADRVIQGRFLVNTDGRLGSLKPFKLNVQFQHGEPIPTIPDVNYQTTIGVSALLETRDDMTFGIAYNHAMIDKDDLTSLTGNGIDGDARALVLGLRWFSENWYLGSVVSHLENHETTDENIYFDGIGWEVYAQYNVYKKWWAVAGWNTLEPDSSEVQAGEFRVKYSVLGVRYAIRDFQQMLFANARFDSGRTQNGLSLGNVYTFGVRWDLP